MTMTKEEVYNPMSFYDHDYREIITKAVCSRGKKKATLSHVLTPTFTPSTILGCWIINHTYEAKSKSNKIVEITGSYDIHVWYAYNDHMKTTVISENVPYCIDVNLSKEDEHCLENSCRDILAKVEKQPTCLQCKINEDKNIAVDVALSFMVNVIGEMKVHVKVEPVKQQKDDHVRDYRGKQTYDAFQERPSQSPFK